MVDLFGSIGLIVEFMVLFGTTLLVITLTHIILSAKKSRFATELACSFGVAVYLLLEVILGLLSDVVTLAIFVLVTPIMVYEAVHPEHEHTLQLVESIDATGDVADDVLCLAQGGSYIGVSAVRIVGIALKRENRQTQQRRQQKSDEFESLTWLYPLWSEGRKQKVTFTIDAQFTNGAMTLTLFVIARHKQAVKAVTASQKMTRIAQTWLHRVEYETTHLRGRPLLRAYASLNYPSLQPVPSEPWFCQTGHDFFVGALLFSLQDSDATQHTDELADLLRELSKERLNGHVLVAFQPSRAPRLPSAMNTFSQDLSQQQFRPPRVEDHQNRTMYRRIAEIEACESTGAFQVGAAIIVRAASMEDARHRLATIEAATQSVWNDFTVRRLSATHLARSWDRLLLRQPPLGAMTMSGARLSLLVELAGVLPGTATRVIPPDFAIPPSASTSETFVPLGQVREHGRDLSQVFGIDVGTLCQHVGIYGNTGSGKTNTALKIVHGVHEKGIPFLVIVPAKTEWRSLAESIPNLRVFTAGDESTAPFRYNFFAVPEGVPLHVHIHNLTNCFIAAWPSEGILTEHIAKVFRRVYERAGWDLLRNQHGQPILLTDLFETMKEVANELEYGERLKQDFIGALTARFESLIDNPIFSVMFNTPRGIAIEELLAEPTILELRHLPEEQRALVTSLLTVSIAEFMETQGSTSEEQLRHLLVLEEAHHVLKKVVGYGLNEGHSSQQKAIDTIVTMLRETRSLGLGILLIDQLPGSLAEAAVKLPGTTIIHSLKDLQERLVVGGQANLNEAQIAYIGSMQRGEVIVHMGLMGQAFNAHVARFTPPRSTWSNREVVELMRPFYEQAPHLRKQTIPQKASPLRRTETTEQQPDISILHNLQFIVHSDGFTKEYQARRTIDPRLAETYVREIVQMYLAEQGEHLDAQIIEWYTTQINDYLREEQVRRKSELRTQNTPQQDQVS
ncbi:MAG: ATP-binding protein [Candidatus Thorarchaeota archaeon]